MREKHSYFTFGQQKWKSVPGLPLNFPAQSYYPQKTKSGSVLLLCLMAPTWLVQRGPGKQQLPGCKADDKGRHQLSFLLPKMKALMKKWRNISWNIKMICLEFGLQNHKNMQNLHASKNFTSFAFVSNPSSEYFWDGISSQTFCIQACYLIPGSAWGEYECFLLTISLSGSWSTREM